MTLLEICVDSPDGAILAAAAGADRVELCSALPVGGVTPSAGALAVARASIEIPIMVLVRPRAGDFVHGPSELAAMAADIDIAKASGANGVVLGVLTPEGDVDEDACALLIERARPLQVTFHRAFDHTRDAREALAACLRLGVERVLTSGQAATASEAIDLLTELVTAAGDDLIVMPGGGVREFNVAELVAATGCREVHASAGVTLDGPTTFRNDACSVSGAAPPAEHERSTTDPAAVRALKAALQANPGSN